MRTSYRHFVLPLFIIAALAILVSCSKEEQAAAGPDTHPLKGEVVKIEKEDGYMTVAHEEIPDVMKAMTMSLQVKDSTAFDRVQVGDIITATLVIDETRMWLENVQVAAAEDTTQSMQ